MMDLILQHHDVLVLKLYEFVAFGMQTHYCALPLTTRQVLSISSWYFVPRDSCKDDCTITLDCVFSILCFIIERPSKFCEVA